VAKLALLLAPANQAIGIDRLPGDFLKCHGAEHLIRLYVPQRFRSLIDFGRCRARREPDTRQVR
jgi:hypothetical protein